MTAKDVKNYRFLDRMIRVAMRKVDEKMETGTLTDKVVGSNPEYPYELRSFTVGGDLLVGPGTEIHQAQWEVQRLRCIKESIEAALEVLDEPEDNAIWKMTMDGVSQKEIAKALGISQGKVSKKLAKLCEYF